jgi:hypothetical protein
MANKNKLNLTLRPSRFFFTLISGLHLLILSLACVSTIKWLFLVIVLISVVLSYSFLIKKYIYKSNKYSVLSLFQDENSLDPNKWIINFSKQKDAQARLQPNGYISNFFIIIHFEVNNNSKIAKKLISYNWLKIVHKKLSKKMISVIIFPDMLNYSDYHQLRLFLTGY